jgi:hypothetical protein
VIALLGLLLPLALAAAPFVLAGVLVWLIVRVSSSAVATA